MDIKFNTIPEVKAKAAGIELQAVNFLKENGTYAAGNIASIHRVELIFIDGAKFQITWADAQTPEFERMEFKLQPSKPNA